MATKEPTHHDEECNVIDADNNSMKYNHYGSQALTASPLPCLLGSIAERDRLQPTCNVLAIKTTRSNRQLAARKAKH